MTTTADETTRAEIEHAITEHRKTLGKMPAHWTDRRAGLHNRINDLLDEWEAARG